LLPRYGGRSRVVGRERYQYYEFRTLDRPLTPRQQSALREISSRADITSTSFTNFYTFGDFRGDPVEMVKRYFDAFLYLANWGTRELMFRVPAKAVPDARELKTYLSTDPHHAAWFRRDRDNVIFGFRSEDEGGDWESDGEGELASIVPVRFQIQDGDRVPLYLGWLLRADAGELSPQTLEPAVPKGLRRLSAGSRALCDFLQIDPDLVAAAQAPARRGQRTTKDLLAALATR
jgi:hypothetical protein